MGKTRDGTRPDWSVSIVGLVIQQGHVSLHPSFNHNDLFHCVQIVALLLFFSRGTDDGVKTGDLINVQFSIPIRSDEN